MSRIRIHNISGDIDRIICLLCVYICQYATLEESFS